MSTFRVKPMRKAAKPADAGCANLDAFHRQQTKSFETLRRAVPDVQATIAGLERDLLQPMSLTDRYTLEQRLKQERAYCHQVETRQDEHDYWFATTPLLTKYYERPAPAVAHDVLAILSTHAAPISSDQQDKKTLFEQYLFVVNEPTPKTKVIPVLHGSVCPHCNVERTQLHHEGMTLCPNCGESEYSLIHSDRPCFKEKQQQETLSSYTYKRINHFNEWLAEFQAKESTIVPEPVLAQIYAELKKNRLLDPAALHLTDMRVILKKLKLNKFYEHIPYIMTKLTGKQAAVITKDTEEQLRCMFRQLQAPFERHCPEGRSNFLSYRYVLRKLFEILGMDTYAQQFMLPKSKHKIVEYDTVWKLICTDLEWQFIPTLTYREFYEVQ